jgi:hypothetical protein
MIIIRSLRILLSHETTYELLALINFVGVKSQGLLGLILIVSLFKLPLPKLLL